MGKINTIHTVNFNVANNSGVPVTGLIDGNFTRQLFNPSDAEVSGSITITIIELGGGAYRAKFTPNALGSWYINIFHLVHFTQGQSEDFDVTNNTIDDISISGIVNAIFNEIVDNHTIIGSFGDAIRVIRGLSQGNFRITNTTHNSSGLMTAGTIQIFENEADTNNLVNEITTLIVTTVANGSDPRVFDDYKVVRP